MSSELPETFALGQWGEDIVRFGLGLYHCKVLDVPNDINAQLEHGDMVVQGLSVLGLPGLKIEVKTERKWTGHLFWEWWSNKKDGRPGWGQTSPADELFYLFADTNQGYRLKDVSRLKWLIDYSKDRFKLVPQNKYKQNNDSWGYLVPVTWFAQHDITEFNFSKITEKVGPAPERK